MTHFWAHGLTAEVEYRRSKLTRVGRPGNAAAADQADDAAADGEDGTLPEQADGVPTATD
jgi:hypothetical protein